MLNHHTPRFYNDWYHRWHHCWYGTKMLRWAIINVRIAVSDNWVDGNCQTKLQLWGFLVFLPHCDIYTVEAHIHHHKNLPYCCVSVWHKKCAVDWRNCCTKERGTNLQYNEQQIQLDKRSGYQLLERPVVTSWRIISVCTATVDYL